MLIGNMIKKLNQSFNFSFSTSTSDNAAAAWLPVKSRNKDIKIHFLFQVPRAMFRTVLLLIICEPPT